MQFNFAKDLGLVETIGYSSTGKPITSSKKLGNTTLIFYIGYLGTSAPCREIHQGIICHSQRISSRFAHTAPSNCEGVCGGYLYMVRYRPDYRRLQNLRAAHGQSVLSRMCGVVHCTFICCLRDILVDSPRTVVQKQFMVGYERCGRNDHPPNLLGSGPHTRCVWSINLEVHVPCCRRCHPALELCCPDSFAR